MAVGVTVAVLIVVVLVAVTMLLVTVFVCKKEEAKRSLTKNGTTNASREGIGEFISPLF